MSAPRPNPIRWLWQAFGGRIPQRYHEWILHDATVRTWWLRYLLRTIIKVLPVMAALFVFLHSFGGPIWLTLQSISIGLIVAVYYSISYADENTDSRVASYGYPPKHASYLRGRSKEHLEQQSQARYEANWRE